MHQTIIDKLYNEYLAKGYVSEDSVFDALIKNNLPLDEVEYVCDMLLSKGAIIRDDTPFELDVDISDRSQLNYDDIFDEIIKIDGNLKPFVNEIRGIMPPQYREWQNLMPQAKNGNNFAKIRIIEMYLRIVLKIALWHYKKYETPLAEAVQDGCLGLVKAVDKFDDSKQDNFTTYAPWWIRQFIMRAAQPINPLIYYPVHVKDKLFSLYDLIDEHYCPECEENVICPALLNISAEKLSCSVDEAQALLCHFIPIESIEEMLHKDDNLFDDKGVFIENIIEKLDNYYLGIALNDALKSLKQREAEVLSLRLGFADGNERTLEEVGQIFSLTRERIRQIESKALRKLRKSKRANILENFY